MSRIIVVVVMLVVLSGCCRVCREKPPVASGLLYEIPAPYRLVYEAWPTRSIPDFVVIQGGREFVLQPDIPGEDFVR